MNVRIRPAKPGDAAAVMAMMRELADYGGDVGYTLPPPERLAEALAADPPRAEVLLAHIDDGLVGYLSWTKAYSIWLGETYLNLDDLYVRQPWRGQRVGEALMQAFARVAVSFNCSARWEVAEINVAARRFYERLGAELTAKRIARWSVDSMAVVAV